ncbi:MAG: hypothetical protein B6244_08110 [Candidatus Cloacimonetes bacterium 4572_55]|nr:MAG: hypothetical protein B6244_08110 [Candidatus Cloacimonetes bacterium 4572_55]
MPIMEIAGFLFEKIILAGAVNIGSEPFGEMLEGYLLKRGQHSHDIALGFKKAFIDAAKELFIQWQEQLVKEKSPSESYSLIQVAIDCLHRLEENSHGILFGAKSEENVESLDNEEANALLLLNRNCLEKQDKTDLVILKANAKKQINDRIRPHLQDAPNDFRDRLEEGLLNRIIFFFREQFKKDGQLFKSLIIDSLKELRVELQKKRPDQELTNELFQQLENKIAKGIEKYSDIWIADAKSSRKLLDQFLIFRNEELLSKITDPNLKMKNLGALGQTYYQTGRIRKSIDYYKQALELSCEKKDQGVWLGNIGVAYRNLGDVRQAIGYYEQALTIFCEIENKHAVGSILGNIGGAYYSLGDAKQAIDYYGQALTISREIDDTRSKGTHLGNIGAAYYSLGDTNRAINYYAQALAISREIGDKRGEGTHLGNLGIAHSNLGDVKRAIDDHKQALTIAREIDDKRGEGINLGNLGIAYSSLGNVKQAIDCYEQALTITREIENKSAVGSILDNLGNTYSNLGGMKKAIDYYKQALSIAREIGDKRGEGIRLGNLGNAYFSIGDVIRAIDYYEQALTIQQKIEDKQGQGNQLGNLGNLYHHQAISKGDPDLITKAQALYKKAILLGQPPSHYSCCFYLGLSLVSLDRDRCLSFLERSVELSACQQGYHPAYQSAFSRYALSYFQGKSSDSSLSDLRSAYQMNHAPGILEGVRRDILLIAAADVPTEPLEKILAVNV